MGFYDRQVVPMHKREKEKRSMALKAGINVNGSRLGLSRNAGCVFPST